jgi:16S rRNA (guanine527-N7)-methyltransferase
VKGVITRAVASIPETLDRVAAAIEPGGLMLFMKGPDCDDEIAEAARTHRGLFRRAADHKYTLPGSDHHRRLVVYERLDAPAPAHSLTDDDEDGGHPSGSIRRYSGEVREVASESNATFRLLRDLLTGKGVRKHGVALLAGAKATAEVVARHPASVEGWITRPDDPPPPAEISPRAVWQRLDEPLFRELDVSGTKAPLLLIKAPEFEVWNPHDEWPEGCTLFVPFQDPENVGAVLRSAAAFGVPRVVLLREAAHPFHPKSLRASGPAVLGLKLLSGPSIADLASGEVPLIALDADGPDLASAPFPPRFGLIPGVEGPGLPAHLRKGLTRRIPIAPGVESLNAAAAAAVALYEWTRGRGVE